MKKELSNCITIEILSNMRNKRLISLEIANFLKPFNLSIECINDIEVATKEAIRNAVTFAYPNKVGKISLQFSIFDGNYLEIKVQDWGCGIKDVTKAIEPLHTTGGEDFSGMGFTIMSSLMDSLNVKSILNEGTTVTMTKMLN